MKQIRMTLLAVLAVACCVGLSAATTHTITVSPATTYQTITDFGASDCWTAEFVGTYFNETEKEKAAKLLFSQEVNANGSPLGIGLSMWRVNLGAGSAEQGNASGITDKTRRGYCYMDASGNYDWTKCAGQQYFMRKAKEYGVDHMLLFANSAPVYFTKNGKACADSGVSGSNLKDDKYDAYSTYLTTAAKHFIDGGYNITHIDPLNEPQYDWTEGQEGTPMPNTDIAKLAKSLDAAITSAGITPKILLPEACQFKALYTTSGEKRADNQIEAFFNPAKPTYIGNLPNLEKAVAGHSYWTHGTNDELKTVRTALGKKAKEYGIGVFQSEWSMLGDAPSVEAGFPASYDAASYLDIALHMAKVIHCDLTMANVTSWHYWTALAQEQYNQKSRFYLLRLKADGDTGVGGTGNESYGDIANGGTVAAELNLYALGHYSRFIRPGYIRVAVTDNQAEDLNGLLASSYISPDGKRLVTVYVNLGAKTKVTMNVDGQTAATTCNVYRTHENGFFSRVKSLTTNLGKTLTLKAKSIHTVVMDFDEPLTGIVSLDTDTLPKGLYVSAGGKKTAIQ